MERRMLEGRRILIVEDDPFDALEMRTMVEELGGVVLGPVGRLDAAAAIVDGEQLDGAILDVRVEDGDCMGLAERLVGRGTRVNLSTGFDTGALSGLLEGVPCIRKPITSRGILGLFRQSFAGIH